MLGQQSVQGLAREEFGSLHTRELTQSKATCERLVKILGLKEVQAKAQPREICVWSHRGKVLELSHNQPRNKGEPRKDMSYS